MTDRRAMKTAAAGRWRRHDEEHAALPLDRAAPELSARGVAVSAGRASPFPGGRRRTGGSERRGLDPMSPRGRDGLIDVFVYRAAGAARCLALRRRAARCRMVDLQANGASGRSTAGAAASTPVLGRRDGASAEPDCRALFEAVPLRRVAAIIQGPLKGERASIDGRGLARAARRSATRGVETELSLGRRTVQIIDATLLRVLRSQPAKMAEWQHVKRVTAKGSVSRPSSPTSRDRRLTFRARRLSSRRREPMPRAR